MDKHEETTMAEVATKLTYKGQLSLGDDGEGFDILFLSSVERPLAEELAEQIAGQFVTVKYWITDKEQESVQEAMKGFLRRLFGAADCEYWHSYNEPTGYLWTNEEIKIGGHNLLVELQSHIGKWLILEIEVGKDHG